MNARRLKVVTSLLLVYMVTWSPATAQNNNIPRTDLIEDVRQLANTIELAHPDPYTRGGGKVAFHRRLQELLVAIPDQGTTNEQFSRLLLPFVANIGDSHTGIHLEGAASPFNQSPEMPLVFRLVEQSLFVYGAYDSQYDQWFGAQLRSVNGVSVDELMRRQRDVRGIENEVHNLALLGLGLSSRSWLSVLLPEWVDHSKLSMELQMPGKPPRALEFRVPAQTGRALHTPESRITLPSTNDSEIAWGFLTDAQDVAVLRIDGMEGYREAFESFHDQGVTELAEYARAAYERYKSEPAPEDMGAVIDGLPAASDAFAVLVDVMSTVGTDTLIIDLRGNTGGNSIMKEILIYFLYGDKALKSIDDGYQVKKLSPLYFEMYASDSLAQLNEGRSEPLGTLDYDFAEETAYRNGDRAHLVATRMQMLAHLPSFQKWYATGEYHQPKHKVTRVFVLSSPFTYSSGFNLMQSLMAQDGILVGTPSAQAPNNFGDSLITRLQHSGITAYISHKVNIGYPAEPKMGAVVQPDYPLTWERWAASGFDPNAEVIQALELAGKPRR